MKPETHVTDQIAAYALNILDAAEASQVAAHLVECTSCQQALQSYEEMMGQLAETLPQVEPPPTLKTRIMQLMKEDDAVDETAVPKPATTPAKPAKSSWWQNLFPKRPIWQPVLLIALLALLISNLQLRQRLEETSHPAGFGTVTLTSTDETAVATGIIIISADGLQGTLVVQDLPILPETEAYQLWLGKEGQPPVSGGVFDVNENGYRAIWLNSEDPLASYTEFDVTLEPSGGSPQPTGKIVLEQ